MYYLRHQVNPYVILFIERDGSTYLTSMLQTHPEIKADYERFAVLKQKGASGEQQLEWAYQLFSPRWIGRHGAIGFKTKLVDVLDQQGFIKLLYDKNCHIIQMSRKNLVKAVVSRINARRLYEATGYWNLYNEKERLPPPVIDFGEFDQYLQEREEAIQELEQFCDSLELPKMNIVYEDLLLDRDNVLNKLYSFLHIKPHPVQSKPIKSTSDDLSEAIENFDELRGHYAGTKYEAMFDEVLV